jgi:hypothetical protein
MVGPPVKASWPPAGTSGTANVEAATGESAVSTAVQWNAGSLR